MIGVGEGPTPRVQGEKTVSETLYQATRLFIGGQWVAPVDGEVAQSINPSTGKPWALAALGGAQDVDLAVAAAADALKGPWGRMPAAGRARILRNLARIYEQNVERLATLESCDNGQPLRDTRASLTGHSQWYNYYAGLAEQLEGRHVQLDPEAHIYTSRHPVGVVGAIIPWNAPLTTTTWKLATALAAGCTIVIKAAEHTPVTALELARMAEEAGVPAGVVNVVPGHGAIAGARLVSNPNVNLISFTGEHRTAQDIMRSAAGSLKRLAFECGGKSPHILFEDADLSQALNAATHSAFVSCGQVCTLGSRLLVQRSIYKTVVDEIARRADAIRIGNALDLATQMGPQTHEEQLEKTLRYIEIGKSEGARVAAGGGVYKSADTGDGYFVRPTVFADATNDMRSSREEIFGPVCSVIPFDTEEEAVAIANDTIYGLVGGLWTRDVGRAHRVAARIEAGTVWVNTYRYVRWAMPYGGFKISGIGRENGPEALDEFTELKTTVINLGGQYPDAYAK